MKAKLFTLFLAFIANVSITLAWDYEHVLIKDLYYNLDATNKTAEVTYDKPWDETNYSDLTTANIPLTVEYNSIPYSVTSIAEGAFYKSKSLTSVTIPNSVIHIGHSPFYGCENLPVINKIRYADWYMVEVVDKTITSCTIKEGTQWIGEGFSECTALESIVIPKTVRRIEKGALIAGIQERPQDDSPFISKLTAICVDKNNPNFTSIDGVLYDKEIKTLIQYPVAKASAFTIPSTVERIASHACYGAYTYKVTIPGSVKNIEPYAFINCQASTIRILEGVTEISERSFMNCWYLEKLILPNSLIKIRPYAFVNCFHIKDLTLGTNVDSIGYAAFYLDITACGNITCLAENAPIMYKCENCGDGTLPIHPCTLEFDDGSWHVKTVPSSQMKIYVPENSLTAYKSDAKWREYNILPIQAVEVTVTDIHAEPIGYSVNLEWPKAEGAVKYDIEIKKGTETICTLSFNEHGQLLVISFAAPSRSGNNNSKPQIAQQTATGWQYTITGLEPNTKYTYTVIAKKADDSEAYSKTISFQTLDAESAMEQVIDDQRPITNDKFIKNGRLFIQHGDELFNAQGARVR